MREHRGPRYPAPRVGWWQRWGVPIAVVLWLALLPTAGHGQAWKSLDFGGHWSYRWSELYEDRALLGEAGFGVNLDDRWQLGLAGLGTIRPSDYGSLDFSLAYLGLRLERDVGSWDRLGGSLALLAGGGQFTVADTTADTELRTGIGVLEPEVTVGLRLVGSLRVSAGVSYRWVKGIEGDIQNRSDDDAGSFSFVLMLGGR